MLGTDLGCHGLVPWRFTFVATRNVGNGFRMPRPCAVEPHACCYKKCWERIQDATALRRGASRLLLQEMLGTDSGCHGLAPWSLTLVATRNVGNGFRMPRPCAVEVHVCCYKKCWERIQDATALRRGASRLLLQEMLGTDLGCHGLAPWSLTLVATRNVGNGFRMPRPCAVEVHVCC